MAILVEKKIDFKKNMPRSGRSNAAGNEEKLKQADDIITADRIYHVDKH